MKVASTAHLEVSYIYQLFIGVNLIGFNSFELKTFCIKFQDFLIGFRPKSYFVHGMIHFKTLESEQ